MCDSVFVCACLCSECEFVEYLQTCVCVHLVYMYDAIFKKMYQFLIIIHSVKYGIVV